MTHDYYTAGLSHIQGSPTTCATQCQSASNPTQCEADCKSQRGFAYYNAEYTLFGKANATCRPETIEFCPEAQQKANQCQASYGNYASFEDEEYGNMVYNQYTACRLESKIDTCY